MSLKPRASVTNGNVKPGLLIGGARPKGQVRREGKASAGDALLTKRASMSKRAYVELKARILTNQFQSGEYILEEELSEILEMSRTPVRLALVQLQNEGHIQIVPRRGMRIVPLSIKDIQEIYDLLQTLESHAAELVSMRSDRAKVTANLDKLVDQMRSALAREDLDMWAVANEKFHRDLVAASGNDRLIRFANTLLDQSHRVRVFTLRLRKPPIKSTENHALLLRAVRAGDRDKARFTHVRHKDEWMKELTAIVERVGLTKL